MYFLWLLIRKHKKATAICIAMLFVCVTFFVYIMSDYTESSITVVTYYDGVDSQSSTHHSKEAFYTHFLQSMEANRENPEEAPDSTSITQNPFKPATLTDNDVDTSTWYSSISETRPRGNPTGRKLGDIDIYDGLPWDSDGTVYFYNIVKAKDDIYELYAQAGIERKNSSSNVVNSTGISIKGYVNKGQYHAEVDGVTSMGIGVTPTMIDKDYYPSKARLVNAVDSISDIWKYKMAVVVCPKNSDAKQQSNWLYVPASRVDAKAHVFYGGVTQTNIKLKNKDTIQIVKGNTGSYEEMNISSYSDTVDMLKTVEERMESVSVKGYTMGSWGNNFLETYNLPSDVVGVLRNDYNILGIIVWGSSL